MPSAPESRIAPYKESDLTVQVELVLHVRRVLSALRLQGLGTVQHAVLAGRHDVQKATRIAEPLVVTGVRLGGGEARDREEQDESGESAWHLWFSSTVAGRSCGWRWSCRRRSRPPGRSPVRRSR